MKYNLYRLMYETGVTLTVAVPDGSRFVQGIANQVGYTLARQFTEGAGVLDEVWIKANGPIAVVSLGDTIGPDPRDPLPNSNVIPIVPGMKNVL